MLGRSAAQGCLGHGQGGEGRARLPPLVVVVATLAGSAPRLPSSGGWPVIAKGGAKLLLLQRGREVQAAGDTADDTASQAWHLFERLRDNALLIRAAAVEGLSSANPEVNTAITNILGRVVDALGDAARAIYLHIPATGYEHTSATQRGAATGYEHLCPAERRCPLPTPSWQGRVTLGAGAPFSHVCVCRSASIPASLARAPGVHWALAAVHARLDRDLADLHRFIGLETWRLVKGAGSDASVTVLPEETAQQLAGLQQLANRACEIDVGVRGRPPVG